MSSTKDANPDRITQVYGHVRTQIEHEDNLLTQRLNWFLTSQSFLFTAFAIVFNGAPPDSVVTTSLRITLLRVIPFIAILAGSLILVAIVGGAMVMQNLRTEFSEFQVRAKEIGLPPLQGRQITRLMGLLAPLGIPTAFIAVWIWLVLRMFA